MYIPFTGLIDDAGTKGKEYGVKYEWYATIGNGWGWLIGETGYDWSAWSIENAIETRRKFSHRKRERWSFCELLQ